MNQETVRVRFAPSPTGYLHVGSLRTALYNYLFAKKHGGVFVLRIEDTDRNRLVEDATEKLLETLSKFFEWDEGLKEVQSLKSESHSSPRITRTVQSFGNYGPYVQSERVGIYMKYAEELVEKGKAYRCFCSSERLNMVRKEQELRKEPTRYDGCCRDLSREDVEKRLSAGEPSVVRLRIEEGGNDIVFDDVVRGRVSFSRKTVDDQVLLKSDGFPTYHLANVVDDHLMGITHVIRGEEWLPSTPKHILLYEAFGWDIPQFAHLPLLLNLDRSKLSKRQGDVAVEDYLAKGYVPEALLNFVALLGWNPGDGKTQEVFSLEGLVEVFDLDHIHKGGAVFDVKKLDWLNAQYIKKLSLDDFFAKAFSFLEKKVWFETVSSERKSDEFLKKVFFVEQDRLQKLSDVGEAVKFFFVEPTVDPALLPWKKNTTQETAEALGILHEILKNVSEEEWTKESLEKLLLEAAGDRRGDYLWPLRVALSGEKQSPPPFEIAWVIGKDVTLRRIEVAKTLLF